MDSSRVPAVLAVLAAVVLDALPKPINADSVVVVSPYGARKRDEEATKGTAVPRRERNAGTTAVPWGH